jgi:hypothetical protein
LKQVQASELQRQQDTRTILETIIHASPPSNALLLTGVENAPSILHVDPIELQQPLALSTPSDGASQQAAPGAQQPLLVVNDVHEEASPHVLPTLREIQTRQNTHDAAKDLTDLRRLLSAAIQASSDAQILEVLQIGRDEMPEAMKTLQRALEKIIERDSTNGTQAIESAAGVRPDASAGETKRPSFIARRMTLKSFKDKQPAIIQRSKTESSAESQDTTTTSAGTNRTRDTLDREFIESGLDALRRMSNGLESTLPSWTITR